MVLPVLVPAVGALAAMTNPAFRARLEAPFGPELLAAFAASATLMALHKLESYRDREYDHCPVYLGLARSPLARNPRRAMFLSFVVPFLLLLAAVLAVASGPPWHWIPIAAWLGQGLHELHHVAKSASRRGLYPGTPTAIGFALAVVAGLWPAVLHDLWFTDPGLPWLAVPAAASVLWAFYMEDRAWCERLLALRRGQGVVWAPRAWRHRRSVR